jgi:hypothetical protein
MVLRIFICLLSLWSMSISAEILRTKVRTPLYGMGGKFSGVLLNLNPNTTVDVINLSDVDVNGLVMASLVFNDNYYVGYVKKSDLTSSIKSESDITGIDPELKSLFDKSLEQASKEFRDEPTPLFQRFPDQSFGIKETDYDRFSTSICFNDLGFKPYVIGSRSYVNQLKEYQQCERRKIIVLSATALFFIILIFAILRYKSWLGNNLSRITIGRRSKGDLTVISAKDNLEMLKTEIETLNVLKKEGVLNQAEFEIRMAKIKEKY